MKNRINQDYLYTEEWSDVRSVILAPDSLYIHAHDPEDRSLYCASELRIGNTSSLFVEVEITENDEMKVDGRDDLIYSLNSTKAVGSFFDSYNKDIIYIEVTGMSCRIAAPLMNYAIKKGKTVHVVYTEPASYRLDEFRKGVNKDLTERVDGIQPLPGMIGIMPREKSPLFVVLLGFEGGRFSSLIQDQNPQKERITPIVGVPGYRIDYPYIAFWGNQNQMMNSGCWQNVKYAEANSIVDAYMELKQIAYKNRDMEMVVAPIGTKPHAIGAILYALKNPTKVELVYDNPKRSVHRTNGIGKVLACNVTKLFNEN